jgi:hypothetical protein
MQTRAAIGRLSKVSPQIKASQRALGDLSAAQTSATQPVPMINEERRNWKARWDDSINGDEVDMNESAPVVWARSF